MPPPLGLGSTSNSQNNNICTPVESFRMDVKRESELYNSLKDGKYYDSCSRHLVATARVQMWMMC